jgi:hypothetical protein
LAAAEVKGKSAENLRSGGCQDFDGRFQDFQESSKLFWTSQKEYGDTKKAEDARRTNR